MWTMLAGVPGKLKTLIDRLTATRAANLDKLDANITTRAPASTALTNAVWTDARAGKLDLLPLVDPVSESPIAADWPTLVFGGFGTADAEVVRRVVGGVAFTTASLSLVDVVSVTGRGVLNFVAITTTNAVNSAQLQIIIDGVTVLDATGGGASNNQWAVAVGALNIESTSAVQAALDQIPFRSSLVIKLRGTSGAGDRKCVYRLRRTA